MSKFFGTPQIVKATEKAGTNSSFATAVYPYFIDIAKKLHPLYISMITPSRWMTRQGQGISDEWVDGMMMNNNFITIHDYSDATECFGGVEIKGGVNYFLLSTDYSDKCDYYYHANGSVTHKHDFLDPLNSGIVIRDSKALSIINRVAAIEGDYYKSNSFASMVSPKHYFDRDEQLGSNWKGYSKTKDDIHNIKYYLNKNLESCGFGWVKMSDIPKGKESVSLHKIYIPMAGGTGNDSQILGIPFYGEANSVCSYSYLVIGYDKDRHNFSAEECFNILTYIRTKFFRFMVSIKKKTQNTTRDLFQFVPLQDWSKPWTDAELYAKYHLSKEDIRYIESMIKPMVDDTLFDTDRLVDSNAGSFNLMDHGVSAGARIVYTPTGQELTVLEDNKVEYGGEQMTIGEFTAKNMPENSISKSGVCKGPKYFSYNGVSLYKLKESFLGGQKKK